MFITIPSIAQLECDIISERVKAALRNAKAQGKKFGRPPLDEKIIIGIKKLKTQGISIRNIAAELKIGKSSVERY